MISNFQGLVTLTLTLTLNRVIVHTVVHNSSTTIYLHAIMPNFIEIEESFCERTDVRMDGRTAGHVRPTLLTGIGDCHVPIILTILY